MSESMGSELSPQQSPEARADNLLAAGDIAVSNAVNELPKDKGRQVKKKISKWRMALAVPAASFIAACGWGDQQNFPPTPEPTPISRTYAPTTTPRHMSTPESTTVPTQTPESTKIPPTLTPTSTIEPTLILPTPTAEAPPTPTLTVSPMQESSNVSNESPETIHLESKIIDGMETYGDESPLTQAQLSKLYEKLNSEEREMRENTYNGTIFVTEGSYNNFHSGIEHDTFQKSIKRHEDVMNQMVHRQPYPDINKMSIRRIIVVKDDVQTPDHELNQFIKDSDGGWKIAGDYLVEKANYYDNSVGVDRGLLHELEHAIFHLPDQYAVDFSLTDQFPASLVNNIPSKWRIYRGSDRNDMGQNLMSSVWTQSKKTSSIGLHANLQLMRRIQRGNVHDNNTTVPEGSWRFPYEIPESTTLDFGKDYANATVEIFQSREIDINKRPSHYARKKQLEPAGNYITSQNGNLTLSRSYLFPPPYPNNIYNLIDAENSTLLLKISTKDERSYFRWMDIRDYNIPYWQGHRDHVTMNFNLASDKDDPNTFDWTIKYSP